MDFINKLLSLEDELEIEKLVTEKIKKLNSVNNQKKVIGFSRGNLPMPHRGFIGENMRIQFSNLSMVDYGLRNYSYLYDFAKLVKKKGLTSKGSIVILLQSFIDNYFGEYVSYDIREDYFYDRLSGAIDDDEYFSMIDSFDLADLKNKNMAMCTERAAMAQNIMALFDYDVYYTAGYVDYGENVCAHCYNIARSTNGYKIVDFSMPVLQYNSSHQRNIPFIVDISNEEFEKMINDDISMEFEVYQFEYISGKNTRHIVGSRSYTIRNEISPQKKV